MTVTSAGVGAGAPPTDPSALAGAVGGAPAPTAPLRAQARPLPSITLACLLAALATACTSWPAERRDADLVVVGAGIAGLAAALEAAEGGASVIVLDSNSVGGGHAVLAGGFSLVGTPLQAARGYRDDPELAIRDILAWGEDADPWWVRRYVEGSRTEVHDWLVAKGVEFAMILPSVEDSVPRFHFPRGAAASAVLPMLREALAHERIAFAWNQEVTRLRRRSNGAIAGVEARDLRSGRRLVLRAPAVVIATGGFESNDEMVRANWPTGQAVPRPLYVGSGEFATGTGIGLATAAGAALTRMDRQLVYVTGMPNPRDPTGRRGLLVQNAAGIMVGVDGRRFVDETAASKAIESLVLSRSPPSYWLVFDTPGRAQLMIRGGPWVDARTVAGEIMNNPALVKSAASIRELAQATRLPEAALAATIARWNDAVAAGADVDFGRFGPGVAARTPAPLATPPYYAIELFPMTRKSMGGIAIDHEARALDAGGQPVPGLYAAGEVTGVAGINGSHGGSGTFLGPSLLIGRIAGRTASAAVATPGSPPPDSPDVVATADPRPLAERVAQPRPGFWHFAQVHRLVQERATACTECHDDTWPAAPAQTRTQRLAQLGSCRRCH